MIIFGKNNCEEIIKRLNEDFWVKQKDGLNKKISEITQDFINRKLFNSSARISKLVHIHYEYITNLLDSLIGSLEKDYPHLSPLKCKPFLLDIAERDFASLAHKVPGWLHESQLLDQGSRTSFEGGVRKKKEETKSNLDNKCNLWDQRWRLKKRQKRIESIKGFLKWFVGPGIGVAIIVWLFRGYIPHKEQSIEGKTAMEESLPVVIVINRLIEDYEKWLDKYLIEFERKYEKVVDDFVNGKSSQSPLDAGFYENAVLEIDKEIKKLTRNIEDMLLEEYGNREFGKIKEVTHGFTKYQKAVEKTEKVKEDILKMKNDPSKITEIHNKLNRKK